METINTFGLPFYGKGGKIHIKKENRGKFNATKKRTGKTTEELTHSKNPLTRKRAIFAQNAKKWKHQDGGIVTPYGQWEYPGEVTIIPSNEITMKGIDYDVLGVSDTGDVKLMTGSNDYKFDGNYVIEYPLKYQDGSFVDNFIALFKLKDLRYTAKDPLIKIAQQKIISNTDNKLRDYSFGGGRTGGGGDGGKWNSIPFVKENTEDNILYIPTPIQRSFTEAFAEARKQGLKTFNFNGKTYTTEVSENPHYTTKEYETVPASLRLVSDNKGNIYTDSTKVVPTPVIYGRYKRSKDPNNQIFKQSGGIVTPFGQWKYPGEITVIPSNDITMDGVNYPVVGISNTGERKLMLPWMNYKFNGDYVTEYPLKHQTNPYIDLDTFSYNNKTYGNNRKFNMDNMKLLDEYFIGKGVPLNQRQAILFNVLQESGADSLDAHGNGYYGIMGWSKDRYDSIKDKSLLGQAEYLYNTLYNGNGSVDWNHGGKGSGYNSWTDAKNMFINGKTFDDINHALIHGYIRPSSDVRNYRTTNGAIYFQPKKLEGSFVPLPTVDNKITDYSRAMAKGLFEGNNIANIVGTTLGAASTLAASIGSAVRSKKQENTDTSTNTPSNTAESTFVDPFVLKNPLERTMRDATGIDNMKFKFRQQGGIPSTQAIIEGGEIVDYPDGTQLIDTGEQHEYSGERTYRPDGKIDGDPVEFTGIPIVDLKNNPNLKLLSFGANPWAQGEPFIWPSTVNQHGYVNTKVDNYFPKAHQENEINFAKFGGLMQQPFKKPAKIKRK